MQMSTLKKQSSVLYRLCYEARREQVVGGYGGYCGNVKVKGTNECHSVYDSVLSYDPNGFFTI